MQNEELEKSNIFVKNIPKEVKQRQLHEIFEKYGKIISLKIALDQEHRSKGFAYIQFESKKAADDAIQKGAHQGTFIVAMPFKNETI